MYQRPQSLRYPLNTTECCFVQFFSQNSSQDPGIKKNPSGLISPYIDQKPMLYQNELVFQPKVIKKQSHTSKRSISNMKANKRLTNRCTHETEENRQFPKDEITTEKIISPMRGSEAVQRYFSPKPQLTTTMSRSNLQEKKKIEEYFNVKNIQNKGQGFSTNNHMFFKKQKLDQPIQFTRSIRQSTFGQTPIASPIISSGVYRQKVENIQQNKIIRNPESMTDIPVSVAQQQNSQKQNDLIQSFGIRKVQKPETSRLYQRLPQNATKQQNSIEINVHNSIHLKLNEPKRRKQSAQVPLRALQKICEMSKQQSRHEPYLQAPVNPFQHIESFVMQVKKDKNQIEQDQKQFDSIKTKGRPVESMLHMTKDMTKTRKPKKHPSKKNQTGLHDMDNLTVTSQFDEDSDADARERIQESAVLLNFFNPPTHLRDRMDLSRANKQVFQERSGFY